MKRLKIQATSPYRKLIGVGGVGTGIFFKLTGDHTLGRNESRAGELLDVRDYCKLHIITHYVAKLLGAEESASGFEVLPVARIGDDAPGRSVLREMQQVGMDTRFVASTPGKPTLFSVCFQYPDGTGGNITTNNSAAAALSIEDLNVVRRRFAPETGRTIALCAPEVPLRARRHFIEIAREAGALCVASFVAGEIAEAKASGMLQLLHLLAVNEAEAAELVGAAFSGDAPESIAKECLAFLNASLPDLQLVVTLGSRGVLGFANREWNFCPAPRVSVASTAGAGDALLGGVIAGIAAGVPFLRKSSPGQPQPNDVLESALDLAVVLASYTVTSPHTIDPSACLDTLVAFAADRGLQFADGLRAFFEETDAIKSAGIRRQ
jgi:sugar/nucleoside kinase (ribokinase family)